MARSQCYRRVGYSPKVCYYKPRGIPLVFLENVVLTLDELETIRLADFKELYQEQAAKKR